MNAFNTMTASWGHFGIIWNLPVAIAYIRPQRYTFEFANTHPFYTLSFFTEEFRKVLQFCGTKSGREHDKVKETGLLPVETENGNIAFQQSRMLMECRKIYQDSLKKENFLLPGIAQKNYPIDDFHTFYMGEIVNVWIKS